MTTERSDPPRSTLPSPASRPSPEPTRRGGHFVSLQTKFLVGTLLVVASVMSALVIIVEHRQREAIIREVQKRGDTLARDLAIGSTGPLVLYNYTQLEQNVARVATETDVGLRDDPRPRRTRRRPQPPARDRGDPSLRQHPRPHPFHRRHPGPGARRAGRGGALRLRGADAGRRPAAGARPGWGSHAGGWKRRSPPRGASWSCLAVLVLAGAGLASALVARRIARPVRQLAAGAVAISRGELVQRVEPTTWDEIGQLATAFNEMARQLHEQRSRAPRAADGARGSPRRASPPVRASCPT